MLDILKITTCNTMKNTEKHASYLKDETKPNKRNVCKTNMSMPMLHILRLSTFTRLQSRLNKLKRLSYELQ